MDKHIFTETLKDWLDEFLKSHISDTFDTLETFIPQSNLAKLNNEYLKQVPNYSSWDFSPDVLSIIQNKNTKEIKLVLLNRSVSTLSLKEIGEINLYAKLVDAELAFLVSTNGSSNEVNLLLLEDSVQKRLLNYADDKRLIIFSWQENGGVDPKSIMPLNAKEFLLR